jgi:hypothetical protein
MDGGVWWLKKLLFLPFLFDYIFEKLYNRTVESIELFEEERKMLK